MARRSFSCESPALSIWKVTREMPPRASLWRWIFANIIPEYQANEANIDLMRRAETDAPVMELLFVTLFEWAAGEGFSTFAPVWEARYLIVPTRADVPVTALAVIRVGNGNVPIWRFLRWRKLCGGVSSQKP